jgi:hypothetical protein
LTIWSPADCAWCVYVQIAQALGIWRADATRAAREPANNLLNLQELICALKLACAMLTSGRPRKAAL